MVYEFMLVVGIVDCVGNVSIIIFSVKVGLSWSLEFGDLVINEVLFNFYVGGVDFLELYNFGLVILNLQGLCLWNEVIMSGMVVIVVENDFVLLLDSYVVFSFNLINILVEYSVFNFVVFIENDLFLMGDDDGNIMVYNVNLEVLDVFNYIEDWYSCFLSDCDGVSLECLCVDVFIQSEGNWSLVVLIVGFVIFIGFNSQDWVSVIFLVEIFFVLLEQMFLLDQDGFQDVLEIQYFIDKFGYFVQLLIFDV